MIKIYLALALVTLLPTSTYAALYQAESVLGQTTGGEEDFSTSDANDGEGSPNSSGFDTPNNVVIDKVNNRLFVNDYNHRVLVFQLDSDNSILSTTASFVLGQPDFTSNTPTTTRSGMEYPGGLAYDSINNRLFVGDEFNMRVLVFDVTPDTITNGMDASYVLGQTDFTSNMSTTTRSGLGDFWGITIDVPNQRLFVGDGENHRVLVFDVAPDTITNGMDASYVLGQTDFTSNISTTTRSGFDFQSDSTELSYDDVNDRLFVSDYNNNRILVFDVAPDTITNGMEASYVLGQTDFTSNSSALARNSFHNPNGTIFDPISEQLFVVDGINNSRIMIFDVAPETIANGLNAIEVIGQNDYISNNFGTSQNTINYPWGIALDSTNRLLYVADAYNNRVILLPLIKITSDLLQAGITGSPYSETVMSENGQNAISFSIVAGSLPSGLSLDSLTGTISGTPEERGTFSFSIQAADTSGTGVLIDRSNLSITISGGSNSGGTSASRSSRETTFTRKYEVRPIENADKITDTEESKLATLSTSTIKSLVLQLEEVSKILQNLNNLSQEGDAFLKDLKFGDEGNDVILLQKFLVENNYLIIPKNTSYGFFGPLTQLALTRLQETNDINPAVGFFGPLTRTLINKQLQSQ